PGGHLRGDAGGHSAARQSAALAQGGPPLGGPPSPDRGDGHRAAAAHLRPRAGAAAHPGGLPGAAGGPGGAAQSLLLAESAAGTAAAGGAGPARVLGAAPQLTPSVKAGG